MYAGTPLGVPCSSDRRTLGWRLGFVVVLVAAATAAGVVYLTAGDGAELGNATPR